MKEEGTQRRKECVIPSKLGSVIAQGSECPKGTQHHWVQPAQGKVGRGRWRSDETWMTWWLLVTFQLLWSFGPRAGRVSAWTGHVRSASLPQGPPFSPTAASSLQPSPGEGLGRDQGGQRLLHAWPAAHHPQSVETLLPLTLGALSLPQQCRR